MKRKQLAQREPRAAENGSACLETSAERGGKVVQGFPLFPLCWPHFFQASLFSMLYPHPGAFSVPPSVKRFSKWGEEHRFASGCTERRAGVPAIISGTVKTGGIEWTLLVLWGCTTVTTLRWEWKRTCIHFFIRKTISASSSVSPVYSLSYFSWAKYMCSGSNNQEKLPWAWGKISGPLKLTAKSHINLQRSGFPLLSEVIWNSLLLKFPHLPGKAQRKRWSWPKERGWPGEGNSKGCVRL